MRRSSDRFPTTHTASLPRSPELVELAFAPYEGKPVGEPVWARAVHAEVFDLVAWQVRAGVDLVGDGERSDAPDLIPFPTRQSVLDYVEAASNLGYDPAEIPEIDFPFVVSTRSTIFVARKM